MKIGTDIYSTQEVNVYVTDAGTLYRLCLHLRKSRTHCEPDYFQMWSHSDHDTFTLHERLRDRILIPGLNGVSALFNDVANMLIFWRCTPSGLSTASQVPSPENRIRLLNIKDETHGWSYHLNQSRMKYNLLDVRYFLLLISPPLNTATESLLSRRCFLRSIRLFAACGRIWPGSSAGAQISRFPVRNHPLSEGVSYLIAFIDLATPNRWPPVLAYWAKASGIKVKKEEKIELDSLVSSALLASWTVWLGGVSGYCTFLNADWLFQLLALGTAHYPRNINGKPSTVDAGFGNVLKRFNY